MNKRHGTWARLTTLCLTLLLAVGIMGTTAWAAPIAADTGSITVSGVEDDVTVSAYQVMTVNFDYENQQPIAPVYFWKSGEVAAWVQTNYSSYIGDDGSVAEAFTKAAAGDIATFYDKLAAAIKGGTLSLPTAGTCIGNSKDDSTIENLPMGAYLILVENGLKIYRPSAVNIVPTYNENTELWEMVTSELTVKASEPTIVKTVNGEKKLDQGSIGDTVSYTLVADVPTYPVNAIAKQYAISDTPSKGLTLQKGTIKVYGLADGVTTELTGTAAYTQTLNAARPSGKGTSSFVLAFDYKSIKSYKQIRVEYDAIINAEAVVGEDGNPNTAHLDYNNNPYDEFSWQEKTDDTKVYTYGLDLTKVNNATEKLTGAEFTLSKKSDGTDPLNFVKTGDGAYRLALGDGETETKVTTLEVGEGEEVKGKLKLSGLGEGTYYVTETKAPDGYNKPNSPVTITITDVDGEGKLDGKPTNGDTTYDNGYVTLDIVNTKGFQLPTTGGMGTLLFTAGGVAIMGAAIILFIVLRKRRTLSGR